jgi:hypothetical protein
MLPDATFVRSAQTPLRMRLRYPPFAKNAKERGTHCVGNARKIKSLGHPPRAVAHLRHHCVLDAQLARVSVAGA